MKKIQVRAQSLSSTTFLDRLLELDRICELAEMMSGIAHELNQPLGAMTTFSQAGVRMLDRTEPLIGQSVDVFSEISEAALQAGARLQELRRLFDSGPPQQVQCEMADVVAEVQPVLLRLALDARAQLQIEISNELPGVLADRLRIQRVLLALVRNAAEASAGLDADRIVCIGVSSERYCVKTSISDRGDGVSAEEEPLLFRPFFTTKPSGRGLGLSSSRAIIESQGGTMGFNNLPTGGVCFWFKLPLATE